MSGKGEHPKVGLPGKLHAARTAAPEGADDRLIRAVAFDAYQEDRDPADVWQEVSADG